MVEEITNAKPNGWSEWGRYVLKELERLNGCFEVLRDNQSKCRGGIKEDLSKLDHSVADEFTKTKDAVFIEMRKLEKAVNKEMQLLRDDVIFLKWKAGLWGMVAGAIPVLIGALVFILKTYIK